MGIKKSDIKEMGIAMTAFAAGFLVTKAMEKGYEKVFHEDPPNEVKDENIHWGKVAGWTIVSGVATSAAKVLVKRFGAKRLES